MKIVNENIKQFERGLDPKDAMGTGSWKSYKDTLMTLDAFKENGGVLTKGRELYKETGHLIGFWLRFDELLQSDLMYNDSYKSTPAPFYACVKVPTKVMYT